MQKKTAETLKQVADVTLDKPFFLSVDIDHGGMIERLLQKWGIRPKKRVFELKPITLGNLIRISEVLLRIEENTFDLKHLVATNYLAMSKHGRHVAEVIAIAISNSKKGPDDSLINLVMDEFTPVEMKNVLSLVLNRMNVSDFMHSIILIRGLNVLESEPKNEPKKKVSPSEQGR